MLYSTDFEAPVFTVGSLGDTYGLPGSGQDGWRASPREPYAAEPNPWVSVSTQRAASGEQAVQLRMDNSCFNGVNAYGAVASRDYASNPIVLNSVTERFSASMAVYLDQGAGIDLPWALYMLNARGGLSVTLQPNGQVQYAQSASNFSTTFTPGFSLFNQWLTLSIERDPQDVSALRLGLSNGSQSWQQVVTSPGGAMTQFGFTGVMPTFPTAMTRGSAFIDDVRIGFNLAAPVPEAGTWALWLGGVGLLTLARRRPG